MVNSTLSALPTLTKYPTYTYYPTITERVNPSRTNTPSLTQTLEKSLTPTEINAITATPVENHIPGILFKDTFCGISFEYPYEWIVEPTESLYSDNYPCFFGLKPVNYTQIVNNANYCMGEYALYVSVLLMGFDESVKLHGFVYEGGQWYTSGRHGMQQTAQLLSSRGLFILRGRFFTSTFDKKCEGYIGIGENDRAVLYAGGVKTIGIADESTAFQLYFEYILQTMKFIES